jgi:hypothetical protein
MAMPMPNPNPFIPPTAAQVQAHLARHPARLPSRWPAMLPMVLLATLVVMILAMTSQSHTLSVLSLLGVVMLLCLSFMFAGRARRAQALERQVGAAQELAAVRRYPESLRLAWRLLPGAAGTPDLHWRTIACMGQVLDQLGAHEAALSAYEYLTQRFSADQPVGVHLRLQRAVLLLILDRMIDADQALRSLRGPVEEAGDPVIRASYRLACLQQQVRTNHFDDALAAAPSLLADLRPLGVEAGFGHALMALSFYKSLGAAAASPEATATAPAQAGLWWSRATLLLPLTELVRRYAALAELAQDPVLAAATANAVPPSPGGS